MVLCGASFYFSSCIPGVRIQRLSSETSVEGWGVPFGGSLKLVRTCVDQRTTTYAGSGKNDGEILSA